MEPFATWHSVSGLTVVDQPRHAQRIQLLIKELHSLCKYGNEINK